MYSGTLHLVCVAVSAVLCIVFGVLGFLKTRSGSDAVDISNKVALYVGGSALCLFVTGVLVVTYIIMQGLQ